MLCIQNSTMHIISKYRFEYYLKSLFNLILFIGIISLFLYFYQTYDKTIFKNGLIWILAFIFIYTLLNTIDLIFNQYKSITLYEHHVIIKILITGKIFEIKYKQINELKLIPIKNKLNNGYYELVVHYESSNIFKFNSFEYENFNELKNHINSQYLKSREN